MSQEESLSIVHEYVAAVNAFDIERIMRNFTADALVNDARREFAGTEAIRDWASREIVGDHVTMDLVEVIPRGAEVVVRARFDGDFDKTGLPPELILTSYFTVREGKISTMIVIFNRPSSAPARG